MEGNLPFLICFTLYFRAISKYKPAGGMGGGCLYLEGRFNGGFFALRVWGTYIWRGLFSEFYCITAEKSQLCAFQNLQLELLPQKSELCAFQKLQNQKTPKISSMNQ